MARMKGGRDWWIGKWRRLGVVGDQVSQLVEDSTPQYTCINYWPSVWSTQEVLVITDLITIFHQLLEMISKPPEYITHCRARWLQFFQDMKSYFIQGLLNQKLRLAVETKGNVCDLFCHYKKYTLKIDWHCTWYLLWWKNLRACEILPIPHSSEMHNGTKQNFRVSFICSTHC